MARAFTSTKPIFIRYMLVIERVIRAEGVDGVDALDGTAGKNTLISSIKFICKTGRPHVRLAPPGYALFSWY